MMTSWYIRMVFAVMVLGGAIFALEYGGVLARAIDDSQMASVPAATGEEQNIHIGQ